MNQRLQAWRLLLRIIFVKDSLEHGELHQDLSAAADIWPTLISFANANLVTATLWTALQEQGIVNDLPEEVRDYLESFYWFNRNRNEAAVAQLSECVRALEFDGIRAMPIKGAAHLVSGLYPDIGSRFLLDIDILIPVDAGPQARQTMSGLGYVQDDPSAIDERTHHHLSPMVRDRSPVAVELHLRPAKNTTTPALSAEKVWRDAREHIFDGSSYFLADPTDDVILSFLHVEVSDSIISKYLVPLRSLFDVHLMSARHRAEIDWDDISIRLGRIHAAVTFRRYVYAFQRLSAHSPSDLFRFTTMDSLHFSMCMVAVAWPETRRWMIGLKKLSLGTVH